MSCFSLGSWVERKNRVISMSGWASTSFVFMVDGQPRIVFLGNVRGRLKSSGSVYRWPLRPLQS